ncbi:MAG: acyl-CoA synthetase [Acidobacteriota bacterium]|nr:acyl-CoA synthetase [Acidobacteriota bacterium]
MNPYETDLDQNRANYVPLTPLSFVARAAAVFPEYEAVVHGSIRLTWAQVYDRSRRLASAIVGAGIQPSETVAVMATNTPPMYEAHFGVSMAGAVLNALNYRLDAAAIAFILEHAEAKMLLTDTEFAPTIREALAILGREIPVIDLDDPEGPGGQRLGSAEYEDFIAGGDPGFEWTMPDDEWQAISLNYTSGTTGNPKGVVYHHRGAYLNAVCNVMAWSMPKHPVYLWTLPMFHCNGWCFPWTLAAVAGVSICQRKVETDSIYDALAKEKATHLCGAPIVMQLVLAGSEQQRASFDHQVYMLTAAAPPPASVLGAMAEAGFNVTHVYGLTETYGPAVLCEWKDEWNALPADEQATLKSRQGVPYPVQEGLMVADPETMEPVPKDGETMGEVFMRGNITMKGYLKNPAASDEAFRGGWFHSGDLGVWHPDNYIQLKDRSKDIIISGGENISSIEVEDALYRHPAVAAVAVVARPDERWGETPCAVIELKPGAQASEEDIIAFCRDNLAHFKCPRHVIFRALPKTSTGKIQKFKLRDAVAG